MEEERRKKIELEFNFEDTVKTPKFMGKLKVYEFLYLDADIGKDIQYATTVEKANDLIELSAKSNSAYVRYGIERPDGKISFWFGRECEKIRTKK